MSRELTQYIYTALSKGANKPDILDALKGAGWSEAVIQKTLEQFGGVDTYQVPIPSPRMQAHQIARDIFIYCLILVTLGMSALATGGLLFKLIDRLVTETVFYMTNVSWSMAQLIISFPVYLLLNRVIGKDISRHPQKRESLIRKLVIYALLGLTAITGLCDMMVILSGYLEGTLTHGFTYKALVVMGISALIFTYYLLEMRRDDNLVQKGENL